MVWHQLLRFGARALAHLPHLLLIKAVGAAAVRSAWRCMRAWVWWRGKERWSTSVRAQVKGGEEEEAQTRGRQRRRNI